jgi:hypothetical protein
MEFLVEIKVHLPPTKERERLLATERGDRVPTVVSLDLRV